MNRHQILNYLRTNPESKARWIAKDLGLERRDVNSILYQCLQQGLVRRDPSFYTWSISNQDSQTTSSMPKEEPNHYTEPSPPTQVQESIPQETVELETVELEPMIPPNPELAKASAQIFNFLEEWFNLNRRPLLDIKDDSRVRWSKLSNQSAEGLPGIDIGDELAQSGSWLSIQRLEKITPPEVPEALEEWVSPSDLPTKSVTIAESIKIFDEKATQQAFAEYEHQLQEWNELPESEQEQASAPQQPEDIFHTYLLEESPELVDAWQTYLTNWNQWSESEIPRRKTIELYHDLFSYRQQLTEGNTQSPQELVWGVGMTYRDKNESYRFPLISIPVEFSEPAADLSIQIRPIDRPSSANLHALFEDYPAGAATLEKHLQKQLSPSEEYEPFSPFDQERLSSLLNVHACAIDSEARFMESKTGSCDQLTFTLDWVVMVQERSMNYMIEDVQRLKKIAEDGSVPPCALVDIAIRRDTPYPETQGDFRGFSDTGVAAPNSGDLKELYFPKPYNQEQVEVVRKLESSQGVVLQGPPGTGKTHTIANIITHYLAMGKRVLVTSHKTPALRVLRSQLPDGIQMLTGLLLENDNEGKEALESSVNRITTEILNTNEKDLRDDISVLNNTTKRNHEELAINHKRTAHCANQYRSLCPPHLGACSPRELAEEVASSQSTYNWFPDKLDSETGWTEDSIDAEFFEKLRNNRKELGDDLQIQAEEVLPLDLFPSEEKLVKLHQHLQHYRQTREQLDNLTSHQVVEHLDDSNKSTASALLSELTNFAEKLSPVEDHAWHQLVAFSFHCPDELPSNFRGLEQDVKSSLEKCVDSHHLNDRKVNSYALKPVTLPTDAIPLDELRKRVELAAQDAPPFTLVEKLTQRTQIKAFQTITLKGSPPSSTNDWNEIKLWIELHFEASSLAKDWNLLAKMFGTQSFAENYSVEIFTELRDTMELIQDVRQIDHTALQSALIRSGHHMRLPGSPSDLAKEALVSPSKVLNPIIKTLKLLITELDGRIAEKTRKSLLNQMQTLPLYAKHYTFIKDQVGDMAISASRIEEEWRPLYLRSAELVAKLPAIHNLSHSCEVLQQYGAHAFSKSLASIPYHEESADAKIIPSSIVKAWTLAKKLAYLQKIDTKSELLKLNLQRLKLEKKQAKNYEDLAVKQTWLKLKETFREKPNLVSSLKEFVSHIKKVGRGTGKLAPFHRAKAQEALKRSDESIRCWIMPQWRVSESLPATYGLFDLVIIDEASQSDLKALPAIARGKKVLVVGDDKQVSPLQVGTRSDSVTALYNRFLKELPYGASMTIKDSIYDLASIAYGAATIRLREHFRCVEPIINFSSKQFYDGEIKCLRIPTAEERLSPVLVDIYLEAGIRDSRKKINQLEADYIIAEIQKLSEDSEIGDRSIGIISLLGNEQSKFIWDRLIDEVPEETILKHNIRCGDSSTFQGSEFDIVFLSMVNHERKTTLTGDTYQQRYNVAASRARDRMYLCRSIPLEDLKATDLRHKLIRHFSEPDIPLSGAGREECESPFEEEVFDFLSNKDYMVSTQVVAAGFRIDLVVEDVSGRRLAIECDGYIAHPEHKWADDMQRQRILERAGWTFHRIWGPSYYQNKEAALEDLLNAIRNQDIEPHHGGVAIAAGLVEHRHVEAPPIEESDHSDEDTLSEATEVIATDCEVEVGQLEVEL